MSDRKRTVSYWPNKWLPNVADASYSRAAENTLDGVFSKVNTNMLDSCLVFLVNVSLLSTDGFNFSFEEWAYTNLGRKDGDCAVL